MGFFFLDARNCAAVLITQAKAVAVALFFFFLFAGVLKEVFRDFCVFDSTCR